MTLLPTFTSACELACKLPDLIADFMDLERQLTRNFREDSLSDILVACLLQLSGNDVVVITPPEHRTGSDFDLVLADLAANTIFQYRIQAKRLIPNDTNWKASSYRELAHKHNSDSQVSELCKVANLRGSIPTSPLYAFYNPASVATPAGVPGIALADAFDIEDVIITALGSTPRPRFKQLSRLQQLFFPLTTILCPPVKSGRGVAAPQESRDQFEKARRERGRTILGRFKSEPAPRVGHNIPATIRRALSDRESPRIRQDRHVKRPQVIISTGETAETAT